MTRYVEERTGQECFDSQAHEIINWQYYDEIHHEHSLNHCQFTLQSFLHGNGWGLIEKGAYLIFGVLQGVLIERGLDKAFTVC